MDAEKILQQKIKEVPKEIENYLLRGDWSSVAGQISQNNNFSEDQKTALENEILFVILGMELVTDFQENLQNTTDIDPSLAESIASEITEKIFAEVAEFLPAEMESEKSEQAEEKISPSVPEVAPEIHPVPQQAGPGASPATVPGESAHDTTPEEAEFMEMSNSESGIRNQESGKGEQSQEGSAQNKESGIMNNEEKTNNPTPPKPPSQAGYPGGQDPYREPIE